MIIRNIQIRLTKIAMNPLKALYYFDFPIWNKIFKFEF